MLDNLFATELDLGGAEADANPDVELEPDPPFEVAVLNVEGTDVTGTLFVDGVAPVLAVFVAVTAPEPDIDVYV
jgi:hypothetical protein